MLNIIKFAAKMALQNPKVREGIKKVAIKSYNKAKPILEKILRLRKKHLVKHHLLKILNHSKKNTEKILKIMIEEILVPVVKE